MGRLTWQKGVDILTRALSWLLSAGMQGLPGRAQVVLMGEGEQQYRHLVHDLEMRHRGAVCGYTGALPFACFSLALRKVSTQFWSTR